jgi:hypothetical protein
MSPPEIRTGHLTSTGLERYRFSQLSHYHLSLKVYWEVAVMSCVCGPGDRGRFSRLSGHEGPPGSRLRQVDPWPSPGPGRRQGLRRPVPSVRGNKATEAAPRKGRRVHVQTSHLLRPRVVTPGVGSPSRRSGLKCLVTSAASSTVVFSLGHANTSCRLCYTEKGHCKI